MNAGCCNGSALKGVITRPGTAAGGVSRLSTLVVSDVSVRGARRVPRDWARAWRACVHTVLKKISLVTRARFVSIARLLGLGSTSSKFAYVATYVASTFLMCGNIWRTHHEPRNQTTISKPW